MSNFNENCNTKKKIMQTLLFRADSSSTIGTGHIMRDLVLAKQYDDANIIFVTQELDGNINHKVIEAGYKIELLQSNDVKEFIKVVEKYRADLVVIDNYQIDYKYEQTLKKKTGVKILAFDDTYEKHHCDILLNHNISADKSKYKGLVPKSCELKCGNKYTLIRQEFIDVKNNKTIFIAMGGADDENISYKIIKVLKKFRNIKVNLVTTTANPNIKVLQKYIKGKDNIHLYINSNKLASLMKHSDLAIVSPSVIVHEVLYMELPFIAIRTADNQNGIYNYLRKIGFPVLKEFNQRKLIKLLNIKGIK